MFNKIINLEVAFIENLFRKHTERSTISIDLKKDVLWGSSGEKYFFGTESNKYLKLIRIKNPLEMLLPKMVICFDKNNFQNYSIRLGYLSLILYSIILVGTIALIALKIFDSNYKNDINSAILLAIFFTFLFFIEYKLVLRKINLTLYN